MIINKCKFAYTQQRASVMINLEPGIQWTHSSTLIGKNAANCFIYPRTSTKFDHLIFLSFLSSKTRRKHTKLQIWVMSTETPLFVRWDKLSVQFSRSVMSNSLQLHELQHTRPPCSSPTPRVHPNPCPSSQWCHPTISSSVVPFSSCPQSFPASGSFPMSQVFASGGQSIGVSASTSVPPMNTQDWSPLGWTGWISLQSKGLSRVFSNTTVQKHQFFSAQLNFVLALNSQHKIYLRISTKDFYTVFNEAL